MKQPRDSLFLGLPRVHWRETDSTNERGRELALSWAPHGTLVTAAAQTAGRGRQGRTWAAPPGQALLMSLVLRDWPLLLPLASAVAVADVCGPAAAIKWPNDIWLERRKLAGILIEANPQQGWAVVGIGLNVAVELERMPPDLRETAATLGRAPGEIEDVLAELLAALQHRLGEASQQTLAAYRERDALLGREISWKGGSGRAAGVDDEGRLLVDGDFGDLGSRLALAAGEVHLTVA